jgi:hypothetical protein
MDRRYVITIVRVIGALTIYLRSQVMQFLVFLFTLVFTDGLND